MIWLVALLLGQVFWLVLCIVASHSTKTQVSGAEVAICLAWPLLMPLAIVAFVLRDFQKKQAHE